MWRPSICLVALTLSAGTFAPGPARAEEEQGEDSGLEAALKQGDEAQILASLKAIAKSRDETAVPALGQLLERGGSEKVLVQAFKTSAKLGRAELSRPLGRYVAHRTESIRRGAVRALVRTKGKAAVAALRRALRSPDAMVRGTAASGLGGLGAKEALDDLFLALDHNVGEAAASIGQLCDPAACKRLLARLGKSPLDIITSGIDQILFRPQTEVSEDDKIRVIGQLRELGTKEAVAYLKDVLERWPKDASHRVRRALQSSARSGGAGQ